MNAKREAEQSAIQAPSPLTKKQDGFKQSFPFKGIKRMALNLTITKFSVFKVQVLACKFYSPKAATYQICNRIYFFFPSFCSFETLDFSISFELKFDASLGFSQPLSKGEAIFCIPPFRSMPTCFIRSSIIGAFTL